MSEIQNPIHMEFGRNLRGKNGLICESVLMELKEFVSMCGGPNEKLRADRLINCLSFKQIILISSTFDPKAVSGYDKARLSVVRKDITMASLMMLVYINARRNRACNLMRYMRNPLDMVELARDLLR
ncbi:hypothetical protein JHK87_055257 [Glycine soja]|nr:hypothetical protein JHK87_055257 [Glycine soja]